MANDEDSSATRPSPLLSTVIPSEARVLSGEQQPERSPEKSLDRTCRSEKVAAVPGADRREGAFVNVLAVATSAQEYGQKVQHWAEDLLLFVGEIEDVEPFEERIAKCEVAEELIDLNIRASDQPSIVF